MKLSALVTIYCVFLFGCARHAVYRIPVAIPVALHGASQEIAGCNDALDRAYRINKAYSSKVKNSTAIVPILLATDSMSDQQYYDSCMVALQEIGRENTELRSLMESSKTK